MSLLESFSAAASKLGVRFLFRQQPPKRIWNMWEHDGWGNSLSWMSSPEFGLYGFLPDRWDFEVGNEVRSEMESGKVGRFRVTSVDYKSDPKDMFFAKVSFIGYLNE